MRVMVLVKASKDSESGKMPDPQDISEMGSFNEELAKAGVLLEADGLFPSSNGKRVRFDGDQRKVINGPFPETKDLIAGYWIWRVDSMDEAVHWLKQAPFGEGAEVEIRPIAELEAMGVEISPEMRAQQERVWKLARKNKAAQSQNKFPVGWDEDRVKRVSSKLQLHCAQIEEEGKNRAAEDGKKSCWSWPLHWSGEDTPSK